MARGYRSRRYRPSRRIGRRFKKSSSLRKIKKDILKCNFPTKVKFMGLSEKKVMFLTKTETVNLVETKQDNVITKYGGKSIVLSPTDTTNITSIMDKTPIAIRYGKDSIVNSNAITSNWDKICVLGIYIKFQPTKNNWSADGNSTINEVKCTYTYNNIDKVGDAPKEDVAASYDHTNTVNKQVFTFNSNEAFTLYIPAPPTMCSDSPVVHKSKTWWSLTDLYQNQGTLHFLRGEDESMEEDEYEEEISDMIGTPFTPKENPVMHCGRLFLESTAASYNVTINYKVALKG